MSRREDKRHYLLSDNQGLGAEGDLDQRLSALLDAKMHGIAFSAYTEEQKPGDPLSVEQIQRRMAILAPH
ncbi:MAG: glycosyl hydrolase, partial [Luminiphilus sp.]